ncbi:hypothetical protein HYE67_003069 [Fusarium culmorum]|uniref:Aminoglycoside phosphotransferase domain-containing protein n=1 Tax=Fusarium culmorum TaxID=5516 RepID=A0A7S8D2N0_FUSCU|nr:hypothetical protein HYE67_003069 [Fusarium culmorum]
MSDALAIPGQDPEETPVLNPNIEEDTLRKLYHKIAVILSQLSRPTSTRIGSLIEGSNGQLSVAGRPITQNMNSMIQLANIPKAVLPEPHQTYESADGWYTASAEMHMAQLLFQHNDLVRSENDCRNKYVARFLFHYLAKQGQLSSFGFSDDDWSAQSRVSKFTCAMPKESDGFRLWCDDLRPVNLLVNQEDDIIAAIDWEFTYVAPMQFSLDPPWWLLLEALEMWSQGIDDWADLYNERLTTWLLAMEDTENDETRTSPFKLSDYIRESWSSVLDGKEANDQSLMLRYGTMLAFCAKASLGTAAAVAFQQRAWLVIRHKMARIDTVDSIFTANTDIFSLLTWSSIKKAKIGTLIAIYCWITPLVVVLTSETLSVVVGSRVVNGTCPNVRTLNFSNEKSFYWRNRTQIDGLYLIPVSEWNSTYPGDIDTLAEPSKFDYWSRPSQQWQDMIASRVALSNEPLVRKGTGEEICSSSWNCSYVLNFVAPGYKCEKLASGIDSKVQSLGQSTPPFNTSVLAPSGDMVYHAVNDLGEYGDSQIPSDDSGFPKQSPPFPKNLGAFRTEPIMWIGYCTVEDYSKSQPNSEDVEGWHTAYTPVIFGCEHYEVNYTIQFDYVGGVQSHKVLHRDYLRKPSDVGEYRLTGAYHSLGYALRRIFNGTTTMPRYDVQSKLLLTPLIDRLNYLPVKNLPEAIVQMYENMIISLLAEPSINVVSWASNGEPSGAAKGGPSTNYPCQKQRYTNVFEYNKVQLLAVYAASIALATAAVLLGLQAYREEGRMRDMKPPSIIAASRASELHESGVKGEARIGYGLVEENGRNVRSFGVEGNVTQQQSQRVY